MDAFLSTILFKFIIFADAIVLIPLLDKYHSTTH